MAGPGSTFTGPLIAGPKWNPDSNGPANTGLVVLSQGGTLTQNGTATVSGTIVLPPSTQILDVVVNTVTAWNSGTSDTFSAGITAGGTDYASGVSVASTGRVRPTFTATQLGNMQSIGTNTTLIATVTPAGGAATAGLTYYTVEYIQNIENLDSYF